MNGKPIALAVAIGATLWLSYSHGVSVENTRWEAKWNLEAARLANVNKELLQQVADLKQVQQTKLDKVSQDAEKKVALAETAASAADTAADRLHQQASRLAAELDSCTASATAERRKTAAASAMVLADVLRRADKRAGELARAYDRARIAGLTCEEAYEILKARSRVETPTGQ